MSPRLVADWKSLGVPFSKQDAAYVEASSVFLSGAVGEALLLPMGHLYGRRGFREGLGLSEHEEHARVTSENDHVARQASLYPGRATAFCAVDYLRPYAWQELRRCRAELASPGIKLHLASAGTELRNDAHLDELARVLEWADREDLAVMLHVETQEDEVEIGDVERLITRALQPLPDLRVCIAHLGGSGGYGGRTRLVFAAFRDWLIREENEGRQRPGVYFDVSAVWLEAESEGVPASTPEHAEFLREHLHAFGTDRLVFGSDYPVFDPARSAQALRAAIALTDGEWSRLMANRFVVPGA